MQEDASHSSATILVVDDNSANRELARATLEDEGHRVVVANNGTEGLAAFEAEAPDCALLDVRMPGLDGFGLCEQIRLAKAGKNLPVIFLTALRDVDTFDRALRAGGDDFLTKPVRPTELVVRVRAALKLRKLDAQLQEHYELLKAQRDALIRLQLQKERLTMFVVHDLKSPVNAIDLHAQLLLRDKSLSADAQSSVRQIRAEARQLNRMVMNLLDLSKGDEGKLTPARKSIAIEPLVRDVVSELEALASYRNVALESALSRTHIYADEDLIRRVLTNLVENAVRHAPPQSTVTIGVRADSKHSAAELQVLDRGTGIPESLREHVFEPFKQLEGDSSQESTLPSSRSGRGLGLTFCKLVAEAHGGKIWIEDAKPGAAFMVRLPDEGK